MTGKAIVSPNCRIRYPDLFTVGAHSIIDDYCYFSARVEIGEGCHVAPSVTIAGGRDHLFRLGDYSGVASGTRVFCSTNDYVKDLVTIAPPGFDPEELGGVAGDVIFEQYTGIGANAIVLPKNTIPEGTVIGALSLVPSNFQFEPWAVYVGNPLRFIKPRNRERVLAQAAAFRKSRGAS